MFGWVGRVLRVNLTAGTVASEPLSESYAYELIGCRGLAMKYHYEECGGNSAPLTESNKLVIMTGPLTGMLGIGTAQFSIFAGAPLSAGCAGPDYCDHFGAELKYAGYDGLIIEGSAGEPVYLAISDKDAALLPAGEIWGLGTADSALHMTGALGAGARACVIGPAGEALSAAACAVTDGGTAVGHGGVGAVMGFKRFKGIAARGTRAIRAFDPEAYVRDALALRRVISSKAEVFRVATEPLSIAAAEGGGALAVKRHKACFSCPVGCRSGFEINGAILPCPAPDAAAALSAAGDAVDIIEINSRALDLGLRPEALSEIAANPEGLDISKLAELAGSSGAKPYAEKSGTAGRLASQSPAPREAGLLGLCPLLAGALGAEELGRQYNLATGRPKDEPSAASERAAGLERFYGEAGGVHGRGGDLRCK